MSKPHWRASHKSARKIWSERAVAARERMRIERGIAGLSALESEIAVLDRAIRNHRKRQ